MYVLPCGSGKSRVASTLALLILGLNPKIKRVHIVYVNEVLKKKDEEDFKDLWSLLPDANKVTYHSDIDFQPGYSSVVIVDESDEYAFNNPVAFLKFLKKTSCVCLTATYAENYSGGIERNVLKKFDFRVFDKLIEESEREHTSPEF